ncbi:MAG TPA: PAS domain S-box protein, partial [Anaerolineales bacterium]|nr:PAS domain S-box protein [Anaerolineales bacterium]
WEEDFSLVKKRVDILQKEGVNNFRDYFSTHPDQVAELATLVRLVDANQAAMKLSGVEWKDDLLKSPSNPISNGANLNFQEELLGLMSPRMGFKMERIQRNAKGEQLQVLVSGRIPYGYEADWSKVIVSISDISDRKRMEDSLRDREQRLNAIIENEPECIKLLDSDGTVLQMNAAGLEMIEADGPEDVLGKPIYSIVTEEFRQEFQNLTEKVLRGESGKLQFEIVGLKGTHRWLDTHAVPMRNADGEVFALLGITRNITEYKETEERLRASESKFKGFFDSAPDAMIIVNDEGQIILSNTQTEKMFGYSEEELSGRMIEVLVPERFRHKHPGHRGGYFANLRPREMGADLELFALHKNGSEFPVEISLNYHQTGKETIVLCAIRDITDRKNSERILRDSEERFQQMANHIQEIFWMTDAVSGEELYISPAAEAIWGHTPEMLMHNPGLFLRSVLPEDRSNVTQTITDQRNGIKTEVEYRIKGSDGSIRWVWDRAFPIIDESGKVSVVVGIAADISERKSSEKEVIRHLTELEALYENGLAVGRLLEPKDIGDRIISTFSKYLSWHHVAIRLKDPDSDELRLITFNREGLNEEAASDVKLRLESSLSKVGQGLSGWVVQRGQSFRSGSVHDHPQYFSTFPNIQSGLYMPLKIGDVSIGVISVESEEPNAFTEQDERLLATLASQAAVALENARLYEAVQQELSERVRAEEQLEQERNSLAQRVDSRTADLTRAMRELERAMRVKDEFLANMSHELRTPLNAILGLSESLAEQTAGPLNEKQQKYITTISESGYHLLSLINDILDLAKIEAGQVTLDINKVDLNSVCQSSLRMIKQMAQKKNQVVNLDIDPDVSLIWADERRLKQMIVNLLSNAVKYTPKDGTLGLEVLGDRGENKVRVTVWDNGIGIKEQDLPLLFQPFVQLDSGFAREFSGTGLGLALVAQMARLHGGRVSVVSTFGEGSRFTLVLPWEPMLVADTVERMKSTGTYPAVINASEHNRRTILLIEDTPEVVLVLTD